MNKHRLVLTCEHASKRIPVSFRYLFDQAEEVLKSHRGWDPGARQLTDFLGEQHAVTPVTYNYSRLLIEVNRSIGHPQLFSEFSAGLSESDRKYLIDTYYQPYRQKVEKIINRAVIKKQQVIHVSVHSFTPVWEGNEREVEIGLLFDEDRSNEHLFCGLWKTELEVMNSGIKTMMNEPYKGADDGFTTYLRTRFPNEYYLGVEIEVNQKFVNSGFKEICTLVSKSLQNALMNYEYSGNRDL